MTRHLIAPDKSHAVTLTFIVWIACTLILALAVLRQVWR